jgi:hypothetical protein
MPTVIDSKVEPLPAPTIISMMVGELDLKGVPPKAALVAIAQEINMPDVDLVQVGNTVFVGTSSPTGSNTSLTYKNWV